MRSSILSATTVVLAGLNLVNAQTFTDCDPTKKTCPPNPGLGGKLETDFTKKSDNWKEADGTTLKYGPNGAEFTISSKTDAPTIGVNKYIQFGKVSVTMKASPGNGVISSFILESQDLDEIDFEWVGGDLNNVQSNFFGKGNTTTYDRGATHPVSGPMTEFVTYSLDWTKDDIKFYVAGNLVRTLGYNDPKTHGGFNYPQTPMRVKMGSWVGCPDAAAAASEKLKYTCEWAGGPLEAGTHTMYVKSVSIEDYGCGGDYTYTDLSGSYQSIKSSGTCDGKADLDTPTSSSKPSSSAPASTKPGGVLIETSSAVSSKTASATGTAAAATTSASGSASNTLATTATPATGTAASATSSGAASVTANAASSMKPKHKYGVLDMGVMALGLGLGYLVM